MKELLVARKIKLLSKDPKLRLAIMEIKCFKKRKRI
jgi:hypothetical protein